MIRHDNGGLLLGKVSEVFHDARPPGRVKGLKRLIQEEHLGMRHAQRCKGNNNGFSAGESCWMLRSEGGHIPLIQNEAGFFPGGGDCDTVVNGGKRYLVQDRAGKKQEMGLVREIAHGGGITPCAERPRGLLLGVIRQNPR
jgi:hypothetical protein